MSCFHQEEILFVLLKGQARSSVFWMPNSGRLVIKRCRFGGPKLDDFFHKFQDHFARRWNSRIIGTLDDGINNEIDWHLSHHSEHFLEALDKRVDSWLFRSSIVCRIQREKSVAGYI